MFSTAPNCPSVNLMLHYTSARHSHTLTSEVRPRPLPSIFFINSLDLSQALASLRTEAHCSLPIPFCRHILHFIYRRSFSTASYNLHLGFPIPLLPSSLFPDNVIPLHDSFLLDVLCIPVFSFLMSATMSKSLHKVR